MLLGRKLGTLVKLSDEGYSPIWKPKCVTVLNVGKLCSSTKASPDILTELSLSTDSTNLTLCVPARTLNEYV